MAVQDLMHIISEYANTLTQNIGGVKNQIYFTDPTDNTISLKTSLLVTDYFACSNDQLQDIQVTSKQFVNDTTCSKLIKLNFAESIRAEEKWNVADGVSDIGDLNFSIEPFYYGKNYESNIQISYGSPLISTTTIPLIIQDREFELKPMTKAEVILQVVKKTEQREFEISSALTGTIIIIVLSQSGQILKKFRISIRDVLQNASSPFIEVLQNSIILKNIGQYTLSSVANVYLTVVETNLRTGNVQEYNLTNISYNLADEEMVF
ncbi:hypothetical protein P4377_28750 [Bacillus thuringiensis]|nr:hypothetical protein [Bacillus thuringiensis]